ncbi:MAG: sensor histidine kinase [Alphaproteobacteria bacterium]
MRDLRVRFGLVLALAMLPLLIFSVWQSVFDYRRDTEASYDALVLTAQQSSKGAVNTLNRATSVLRAVEQSFGFSEDCSLVLRNIAVEFSAFKNLYIADADGKYVCATDAVIQRTQNFPFIDRLSTENPVALLKRDQLQSSSARAENLIRVAYGSFKSGSIEHILIADVVTESVDATNIPDFLDADNIEIFILNSRGELLAGTSAQPLEMRANWTRLAAEKNEVRIRSMHNENKPRDIIILQTPNPDLFIAYGQPYQSLISWNLVNPLSSALVPVLAWIFGFVAIWLATDRLILGHLRRMRTSVVQFARGDMDQRVGTLKNPPSSIRELGRTLDVMADRISAREVDMADSVDEKDMLLREIHHRVKNNLQIIISLLNMQERKLTDPQGLAAIKDTRSRINAIALVHRGLYESDDLRYIPMEVFLQRLTAELSFALGADKNGISLTASSECMPLEADTAIPVALFVVEALTNSVKHGVPKGGTIDIKLKQSGDQITVSVTDSGAGFALGEVSPGTGSKLIRGFSRQLSGKLENLTTPTGHAVTLTFTHRPYSKNI